MLRILLAEDNDLVRFTLATLLQSRGYDVDQATDGRQAVRRFHEHPSDVVLLDVHMPRMSGLEACRLLRQRSRVPIIMISTNSQSEIQEQVAECGANAFLPKPLEFDDLLNCIYQFGQEGAGCFQGRRKGKLSGDASPIVSGEAPTFRWRDSESLRLRSGGAGAYFLPKSPPTDPAMSSRPPRSPWSAAST